MTRLYALLKIADHPHDRMVERAGLPPEHVERLQRVADSLSLDPGTYHLPIRVKGKLHGYAQFKAVPNRKSPVLATILSAQMKPSGYNIEDLIHAKGPA